jgi:hypothetical protein
VRRGDAIVQIGALLALLPGCSSDQEGVSLDAGQDATAPVGVELRVVFEGEDLSTVLTTDDAEVSIMYQPGSGTVARKFFGSYAEGLASQPISFRLAQPNKTTESFAIFGYCARDCRYSYCPPQDSVDIEEIRVNAPYQFSYTGYHCFSCSDGTSTALGCL